MKLTIRISILTIFLWGFESCAPVQKPMTEIAPSINMLTEEVNTRLKLTTVEGITDLKIRRVINLDLININHNEIGLPSDFGVRVFMEKQNGWTEIKNNYGYTAGNNVIAPQEVDKFGDAIVPIYPVIPASEQPVMIRIIVIGTVYENSEPTSTKTAAYIDLILQP